MSREKIISLAFLFGNVIFITGGANMAFDADKVIALASELKLARERVSQLERQLQLLVAGTSENHGRSVEQAEKAWGALREEQSMTDRVINFLNFQPGMAFEFDEIFPNVNGTNQAYIRSLLSRLAKEGRIEKRGWGKYGAVTEKERPKAG
jgi:hypothetical protein